MNQQNDKERHTDRYINTGNYNDIYMVTYLY